MADISKIKLPDNSEYDIKDAASRTYVNNAKNYFGYQYKTDIVVYGESNKYYPVYFTGGNQNVPREIMIFRSYGEQAPPDWNTSTHKGGLLLKVKLNYGSWGGAAYKATILDFAQSYSTMFAKVDAGTLSGMAGAFWLRGGGETGAKYHVYSDQVLENTLYHQTFPYIGLTQGEIIMWTGGDSAETATYKWTVPAPLDEPNTAAIDSIYTDNLAKMSVSPSQLSTELDKKQSVKNSASYNPNSSYYTGGTSVKYLRIKIPNIKTVWAMLYLEISIRRDYTNGNGGKLLVNGYHTAASPYTWYAFNYSIIGKLPQTLSVYGSDGEYIYIYTNGNYFNVSIDKMLIGDQASTNDCSAIEMSSVASLPETYQTATLNTLSETNSLLSSLPAWTAVASDNTYLIRQDTNGTASFGRVAFSTLWAYIKGKIESIVLSSSTSSTSTTTAATSSAVKSAYDLANSAYNIANNALPSSDLSTEVADLPKNYLILYVNGSSVALLKPDGDSVGFQYFVVLAIQGLECLRIQLLNSTTDIMQANTRMFTLTAVDMTTASAKMVSVDGTTVYKISLQDAGSGMVGTLTTDSYLTSETDPVFTASPAHGISTANITAWNGAITTANTALSGVNGNLIYDHTFTISNGVATFAPHVYQKGSEVTTNYAKSCFTWKYRLIDGSEVALTTKNDRGCDVTISVLGYGGHVIGTFTPA